MDRSERHKLNTDIAYNVDLETHLRLQTHKHSQRYQIYLVQKETHKNIFQLLVFLRLLKFRTADFISPTDSRLGPIYSIAVDLYLPDFPLGEGGNVLPWD
jgi:hypothetical protein